MPDHVDGYQDSDLSIGILRPISCDGNWISGPGSGKRTRISSYPIRNNRQLQSQTYQIAALDQDFILGESTRGIRLQLEYAKVEEALRTWGVRSTVVVFGSARVHENGPPRHVAWYRQAREFARIVSERAGAKTSNGPVRDNVIATGGGPGLMEAANRGACDAGAPSIGFNITLVHEQQPNAYSTPELTFRFQYFAIRKMHLAMRANALVVFFQEDLARWMKCLRS